MTRFQWLPHVKVVAAYRNLRRNHTWGGKLRWPYRLALVWLALRGEMIVNMQPPLSGRVFK